MISHASSSVPLTLPSSQPILNERDWPALPQELAWRHLRSSFKDLACIDVNDISELTNTLELNE